MSQPAFIDWKTSWYRNTIRIPCVLPRKKPDYSKRSRPNGNPKISNHQSCTHETAMRLGELARQVQQATGQTVRVAFADQGYTGEEPAQAALDEGIELQVIKLAEAKKGFVLLPRRWVVERSFGWLNRFRRLARDYERLPETLAGLHFVVFSVLMLVHFAALNKSA
ncbi:transposase [Paraburkholderia bannensis]|uniref:Transposase n=1 Tax=Paraburkholderia bannensis TaxID=765414 RepID=A0A7W9U5N6_9BURK|nr:transposase [Paraburkholderia sp. WP4_3_2]MBB6106746.1 transposase [Paraburkholderia bannensis]